MAKKYRSTYGALCRLHVIQVLLACFARLAALAVKCPPCLEPEHVCNYSPSKSRYKVSLSYL